LIENDRDEGLHVDDGSSLRLEGLMGTLVLVEGSGAKSSLLSPTSRVGMSSGLDCETTVFGLLGSSCGDVIIIGHRRQADGHVTTPGDGVTTGMGEQLRVDWTSVHARR